MEQLCGLFGLTRQAWYAATRRQEKQGFQATIVLAEVRRLRRQVAGLGTTKLYELMQEFLASHQIKLGRDRLHNLLKVNGLLLTKKRSRIKTTDSDHDLEKYPNQVKELKPDGVGQLWVSDLSYIRVGIGFAYLSVIMDAYSRKIVGWSFHKTLEAKGPVAALEMALKTRSQTDQSLIHHSDRGVQYCSGAYVDRLRQATITISMTESGDPNENALAERVFRTLKEDFHLWGFPTFRLAETAVEQAIGAYNSVRPHASLGYQTPNQAHQGQGYPPLKWYPYKKVRFGNVQYQADNQYCSPL
ncbi:IS3 family transposase [Spirosoma endbachense]|uniref:IS3 family transposase n=1 Tax=Spirosoma endbachense TaxID=2666025 RepID=A0A6P1W9L1_9BACT|nr:IS3 family transposase [Spirosoma endbachense]QHW01093.1 IS3 family transposase [Spirosoma endbachense]